MIVYRCENSMESIFTAIYRAYEERRDHSKTRIDLEEDYYLFAEYIPVAAEAGKAQKVARSVRKRFGEKDYLTLCYALASYKPQKGQAVYQTIVKAISGRWPAGRIFEHLADRDVYESFAMARETKNELHHMMGFLRFQEMKNGILYAQFRPKNDLMIFLLEHFADRFPMENFLILDRQRKLYGIHPAGKDWYLAYREQETHDEGEKGEEEFLNVEAEYSVQEEKIQLLFRQFVKSIAIEERKNETLQKQLLPLRFRPFMCEFPNT